MWFQEILDNDVSEEVEYLKNEDEQWRINSWWYKGSHEDKSQATTKPIDANPFKTYDHRRRLAYSHKKALIRAEIMSKAANDVYRTHKMPMNKEQTFTFEYDKENDEIVEGVVQWKRKHGQPISLFALSANQCKGVKWLMDTGCGHDLIADPRRPPSVLTSFRTRTRLSSKRQMVLRPLRILSRSTVHEDGILSAGCVGA